MKNSNDIISEVVAPFIKLHSLDNELVKSQLLEFFDICLEVYLEQRIVGAKFIEADPNIEAAKQLLEVEKSKAPEEIITKNFDIASHLFVQIESVATLEKLENCINDVRLSGHFAKVDLLETYCFVNSANSESLNSQLKEVEPIVRDNVKKKANKSALFGFVFALLSIPFSDVGIIPMLALLLSAFGWFTFNDMHHNKKWLIWWGGAIGLMYLYVHMSVYAPMYRAKKQHGLTLFESLPQGNLATPLEEAAKTEIAAGKQLEFFHKMFDQEELSLDERIKMMRDLVREMEAAKAKGGLILSNDELDDEVITLMKESAPASTALLQNEISKNGGLLITPTQIDEGIRQYRQIITELLQLKAKEQRKRDR